MNKINAQKTKDMVIIGLAAVNPAAVYTGTDFTDQSGNLFHFICSRNQTHCYQLSDLSFNRNVRCTGIF